MTTITATSAPAATQGAFARMFQAFRIQLRRAIELSGAPYADGTLPPL
jgi:hypothetical protein